MLRCLRDNRWRGRKGGRQRDRAQTSAGHAPVRVKLCGSLGGDRAMDFIAQIDPRRIAGPVHKIFGGQVPAATPQVHAINHHQLAVVAQVGAALDGAGPQRHKTLDLYPTGMQFAQQGSGHLQAAHGVDQ
ncbi:hypothetical protein D3C72_1848740 [compost metagenome]